MKSTKFFLIALLSFTQATFAQSKPHPLDGKCWYTVYTKSKTYSKSEDNLWPSICVKRAIKNFGGENPHIESIRDANKLIVRIERKNNVQFSIIELENIVNKTSDLKFETKPAFIQKDGFFYDYYEAVIIKKSS